MATNRTFTMIKPEAMAAPKRTAGPSRPTEAPEPIDSALMTVALSPS